MMLLELLYKIRRIKDLLDVYTHTPQKAKAFGRQTNFS